ncbi:DinB family protein [Chryseobacterium pennipullorum]|uniref:Damage-inducible protein DinB n=1 Tax=Chryseobacterium pennipullorum TaxID=2258963 RepID=A0A3D9ATR3_9FLAO|nr:DinB family protein [Chryseobacterium pennipullorum]REC44751.1 damage-inducible protein DinB [Chryseobacterium pennipullorum]
MDTLSQFKDEFETEYQTTKKFFEAYPEGKNEYTPHEKSMKMMPLATHIAEIFEWPNTMLNTSDLDFANSDHQPKQLSSREDLLRTLDQNFKMGKEALEQAREENLRDSWALKNNGQELAKWTKYGSIRHALNQITHHRAQLGVYYRLNDIPLPGSYGPSADDQSF